MLRAGIIDILGIANIIDIIDVADIVMDITDIADITDVINITGIADWMLRILQWKQVGVYKVLKAKNYKDRRT